MKASLRDYYNLIIKGNWGFSSTTSSKGMACKGVVNDLDKKNKVLGIEGGKFNDSIISINSTFIEVVDPGNRMRGVNPFFSLSGFFPLTFAILFLCYALVVYQKDFPLFLYIFLWVSLIIMSGLFFPIAIMLIRWDMFKKTHYPIRFNRKNRKVYAYSQDMGVVVMNWDDINFYSSHATSAEENRGMGHEDIRGYVKDEEGNTKYHLMFFKYEGKKMMRGALEIWELVRSYMEEPDGYIKAFNVDQRLLALEDRKEGFVESIIQGSHVIADSIFLQVLFAPAILWTATGRIMAKWTCSVPHWPEWVNEECKVSEDDLYVRNRTTEPPLTFREQFPALCCYFLAIFEGLAIALYLYMS